MERLKSFPALAGTPIVVVSAREPSATGERALAAGAHAFVAKPIDNEKLFGAIRSALNEH